jgi:hypothetical protein
VEGLRKQRKKIAQERLFATGAGVLRVWGEFAEPRSKLGRLTDHGDDEN